MEPIKQIRSKTVVIPNDDIDTDQIIPARFLKTTDKKGLGESLFADWRDRPGFPLLQPDAAGARVLVVGANFGCGSSREHAPWALTGFGFRAIVATSFADIFRGNALKNGLLPVVVPPDVHKWLLDNPDAVLRIDLASQTLSLPDARTVEFPVDSFARHCMLEGVDELGYILRQADAIAAYESGHPAPINTLQG